MPQPTRRPPNHARFPHHPWVLHQAPVTETHSATDATLFTLANGYLGVRGTPEHHDAKNPSHPGTYINGVHDTHPIQYPEDAYGFARTAQTIRNLPHLTPLHLHLDGEHATPDDARVQRHERTLDLRAGTLTRRFTWTASDGARTHVTFTRVVSLTHPNRLGIRVTLEPLDRDVALTLHHTVDANVTHRRSEGDPRVGSNAMPPLEPIASEQHDDGRRILHHRIQGSGIGVTVGTDLRTPVAGATIQLPVDAEAKGMRATATLHANLAKGDAHPIDVHGVYLDTRDHAQDTLVDRATSELDAYDRDGGIDHLLTSQRAHLDAFWNQADVEIEGDPAATQSVRFALFHLQQAASRDAKANLPAKALSGEGYEGHTFWDSEIYLVPTLIHTAPHLARALLDHRIDMLDAARARARELGHAGALYPWRTIDGREASAYFPAGTAQIHIDADVVHALARYHEATDDTDILWKGGAAVASEVARFYLSVGHHGRDGAFHLHTVTGPDEYTALIDDNHYTNRMAQFALRYAANLAERLERDDPARWSNLQRDLNLQTSETDAWRTAADAMHLPTDPDLHVTPQDASFLGKPEWPWDDVPEDRYPLLLHVHPLDIYRHQVLKQADVLLAHHLLPDGVTRSQLRRDHAYYAPRTTHDSSLSPFVHAITAADLGNLSEAMEHYHHAARIDLDDLHGNTADGLHAAALAGTWLATTQAFGGFRIRDGAPTFEPRLPNGWTRLRFRIAWRRRTLEIDADREQTQYRLLQGADLTIRHRGESVTVPTGGTVTRPTRPTLRGVAFDLDGVITDSAEYHYQAWQALADELGIPFDREANEALRGVPRMASLEAILARGTHTYDLDEKQALATKKNEHYQSLIENVTPDDLLPGIPELLDALRDAGVRLALASSSKNGPVLLERLGIADRFHAIVDPGTLTLGKPDPEIFETAAAALDLPVDDCVGIEDAEAGVAAIRGAGMPSVAVGTSATLSQADVQVPDTTHLTLDVLERATLAHARRDA